MSRTHSSARTERDRANRVAPRPQGYPYSQGLDYLRRESEEHILLSRHIERHWLTSFSSAPGRALHACDYGTGFGDVGRGVFSAISARTGAALRVDLVDTDPQLLAYSASTLSQSGHLSVRSLAPTHFVTSRRHYDFLLASHVLYYVADRKALVALLIRRMRKHGQLSLVLRSDRCDTFRIRSAIRRATEVTSGPSTSRPPASRITASSVANQMRRAKLAVTLSTLPFRLAIPVDAVRADELLLPHSPSEATEFVRFLGHLQCGRSNQEALAVLIDELDTRRDGDHYQFNFEDTIITGRLID